MQLLPSTTRRWWCDDTVVGKYWKTKFFCFNFKTSFWHFPWLNVAIQCGSATSLLGILPVDSDVDEIFDAIFLIYSSLNLNVFQWLWLKRCLIIMYIICSYTKIGFDQLFHISHLSNYFIFPFLTFYLSTYSDKSKLLLFLSISCMLFSSSLLLTAS